MKLLMKIFLFLSIYLACNLQSSIAQSVNIAGRDANFQVIFDDTLAGATTKILLPSVGHKGWFRVDQYQFFSFWVDFGSPSSIGLTSVDSVEFLMEQYSNDDVPTSASAEFLEKEAVGTASTREVIAIYDSTQITDNDKTFISFHGTGDPEIAPGTWVRFRSRVVGGFTGAGLAVKLGFLKQP